MCQCTFNIASDYKPKSTEDMSQQLGLVQFLQQKKSSAPKYANAKAYNNVSVYIAIGISLLKDMEFTK
jgi:hypothetical protein